MNYGFSFKGSKNYTAKEIIELLPRGNRLVDLFGGGGAITHCAIYNKKYNNYLYNELNPLIYQLFKDSILGEYNEKVFKPEFITREKFNELKKKDGYIKYIWSFGNNGTGYLFGKGKVEFKHKAHKFIVFKDKKGLEYLEKHFKDSFYWHIKELANISNNYIERRKAFTKLIIKIEAIRVTTLHADTIYNLFKDLSFKEFYKLSQKLIIKAINKYLPDIPKKKWRKRNMELSCLKQLEQFERLEQLQQLQQLQRLQQLERLELSSGIEFMNNSYLDYKYRDDDIVYCDPPYENVSGYNEENFNSQEFYNWVYNSNFPVFFSSYEITDNRFKKIWKREKRNLCGGVKSGTKNENLYCNEVGYLLYEKQKKKNTLF